MSLTDLALQENVAAELAFDPSIDASKIGVAAKDGVITLSGAVASYAQKVAAEKDAKRVVGVRGLASEITVELPSVHQRSDTDIAGSAVNVLAWNVSVPTNAVTVTVDRGWVTLEGRVEWQYQKESAESAVRNLLGVRGLTNHVAVAPTVRVAEVQKELQKAFERHADIDVQRLSIEARNGTVTIRGKVNSLAEHGDVSYAAYSVPGVVKVENLTTVG